MSSELLPCPFCGCEARMYTSPSNMLQYAVGCTNSKCHIYSGYGFQLYETKQEAITAWNQRAERTCITVDAKDGTIPFVACSECGEKWHVSLRHNYCPNCGVKVVE